jgi:disulfide bond formation protein DsbB
MTPSVRAHLLLLVGPAALLGGAFAFQHLGGLYPCELCIWQRWPHAAALILASAALLLPRAARRGALALAALAVLASAGIAVFHVGVEQGWWEGLSTCSAPAAANGNFLETVLAAPVVQCDKVAWSLAGLSMAGYNALLSLLIAGGSLWLLRKR